MAPALSSNPFFLKNITPQSRISLKKPKFTVLAKKAGVGPGPFSSFRLGGKSADDSSSEEESTGNGAPFRFDFGKLPDINSLVPALVKPTSNGFSLVTNRSKDPGTIFVAGATGQAGIRIAQTLLREGFRVRAGVPDLGAAQELALLASQYKIISKEESKRLNAVESKFQDPESIAKAIGNAGKVVVTIGPAENGPSVEVTTSDALKVIQAAELANVGHVAIIYDGSSMNASTNNVLDGIQSFFGNLFSRSTPLTIPELLQKIVETDLRYTLIKTKLTEDFLPESSYNIVVTAEGSVDVNGSNVTKSKIASVVADVFSNTSVAENKVVEVFTDPSAPLKSVNEFLSIIPEDGRRKAYAEALAKAKAEEEAMKASESARQAAEAAKKLGEEVKKLEEQEARAASLAEQAEEKAAAAGTSLDSLLTRAKGMTSGLSWEGLSSQLKVAAQKATEEPKVQVATIRGQTKARSLLAQKAVVKKPVVKKPAPKSFSLKPKESPKPVANSNPKKEVRNVFGGLFKQETIYVDDE